MAGPPPLVYMPDTASAEFTGKTITAKSGTTAGTSPISSHANNVATYFYGRYSSLAPDVNGIDVYEANNWLNSGFLLLAQGSGPLSEGRMVQNHSWIGTYGNTPQGIAYDKEALRRFDFAIQQSDFLACVGLNNGSASAVPTLLASAYNAIAVGLTNGEHSTGTATFDPIAAGDPGRTKPEIVAPFTVTSFATPLVSSAGAMLRQNASANGRHSVSLKAMLLAGATKDQFANWNRTTTRPLDAHFGAGQLNILHSYHILAAGQQIASGTVSVGKRGWDYRTTAAAAGQYFFDIPAGDTATRLSAVLTWNRKIGNGITWGDTTPTVPDLALRIYAATGFTKGALIDESVSAVDNVEHLYEPILPPGRYVMEVTGSQTGIAYGLAWNAIESVRVAATVANAAERGLVPGTFTISRSGNLTNPLTIAFAIGGTATPGADYTAVPASVTIPANAASATVTIAPLADSLAEGDETVTITLASGLAATFADANATVTIHDQPIDAWRFAHFTAAELADPAASGDLADFDHDGLLNIFEYALGHDPKIADANGFPTAVINAGGYPELTYTRPVDAVDLNYIVEISTDLMNWTSLAAANGTGTVTVASPTLITDAPTQFMRLRVTRQ